MSESSVNSRSQRVQQGILIVATLVGSWLAMQTVHELGHVLGAWGTGGRVERVVLHPLTLSRTDLAVNPRPLVVVWAGPIGGVLLPLALWGAAAALRLPGAFVLRFWAGTCLIANGVYLGFGSLAGIGDCGEMLRNGSAIWQLWLFGALTAPAGLLLWHRQGPHFGLGPNGQKVNPIVAYLTLTVCLGLIVLGLLM